MTRIFLAACLTALPALAFAAGGGDDSPPRTTNTTKTCVNGKVWDTKTAKCVNPSRASLDDETLLRAAREFAYAGQYRSALGALAAIEAQDHDGVLTYKGFTHRKLGNTGTAMAFYQAALTQNPNNLNARSYMGQGFVAEGSIEDARAQLTEIRQRGGRGTWAEASLRMAIETGEGFRY